MAPGRADTRNLKPLNPEPLTAPTVPAKTPNRRPLHRRR
jgi:hypothetical protein